MARTALAKSRQALADYKQAASRRLAKLRQEYTKPSPTKIASIAIGGAAPAYLIDGNMLPLPADVAGVPTELLVGGALVFGAGTQKGQTKAILEGVGEGMIAVGAYKFAKTMI